MLDTLYNGKWRFVGTKIEVKIDMNFETHRFEKKSKGNTTILKVQGFRKSIKDRWEINQNLKPKLERLLALISEGF